MHPSTWTDFLASITHVAPRQSYIRHFPSQINSRLIQNLSAGQISQKRLLGAYIIDYKRSEEVFPRMTAIDTQNAL